MLHVDIYSRPCWTIITTCVCWRRIQIKEYSKIKIKLLHNNKISNYSVSIKYRQKMNPFMCQIEFGISFTW